MPELQYAEGLWPRRLILDDLRSPSLPIGIDFMVQVAYVAHLNWGRTFEKRKHLIMLSLIRSICTTRESPPVAGHSGESLSLRFSTPRDHP